MVFQSYALFRHMTVAENITFGPRIQDLDIDEEERYCIFTHGCCIVSDESTGDMLMIGSSRAFLT